MPMPPNVLRNWANGATQNAMTPEEENPGEENLMEEESEGEEVEGKNRLWNDGIEEGEEVEPEELEELSGWLEENEPEIAAAVNELGEAVSLEDAAMIDRAKVSLQEATQYLNPEYPELSEGQKEKAEKTISKHMREKGHPAAGTPEHKQAVAIGLAEARKGESNPGPEDEEELAEEEMDMGEI